MVYVCDAIVVVWVSYVREFPTNTFWVKVENISMPWTRMVESNKNSKYVEKVHFVISSSSSASVPVLKLYKVLFSSSASLHPQSKVSRPV